MRDDNSSADTGADNTSEETPESGTGSGPGNPGDGSADTGGTVAASTAPPARTGRRRWRRAALWAAAGMALVMTAGVATVYGYYRSLRADMVQHDLGSVLREEDRPDRINDAVNILFMGTDGYEEGTTAYREEFEGERSDALMLAHISPENNQVSVVSFPRDSLVRLPQCEPYGRTEGTYGYFGMINAAMFHGGPPCVVHTVESLTHIRVDHFVHLSFMSFRDVVDAIGGVEMCIPEPMRDRRSNLDLEAGEQVLDGDQALSFVRARYEVGDGGDIDRIARQQRFLGALADQMSSSDVLTSPSRLNGVLGAVAQHSATDHELTLNRMVSIAVTLADVNTSDIEFHTVPWYQAPSDPNRVMWHEDQAEELFSAIREDRSPPTSHLAADEAGVPTVLPSPEAMPSPEEGDWDTEISRTRPGEGRDATSNPCADGLGFGTGDD